MPERMTTGTCTRQGCDRPTYPGTGDLCCEHFRKTEAYMRLRNEYFSANPLCEASYAEGRIVSGEEVDHRIALSQGGRHEWSNLQTLSKQEHFRKTGRETVERNARRHPAPSICIHGYGLDWRCPHCDTLDVVLRGTETVVKLGEPA